MMMEHPKVDILFEEEREGALHSLSQQGVVSADVLSGTVAGSGDRHMGLLEEWAGGGNFWTSRAVVLFITYVFVLFPLVAQKHVESLQFTSAVSIALAILYLVITIAVFLVKLVGGQIGTPRMLPDVSSSAAILKLCSIIPVMSNAFICHFNVHPIWVEMKDRSESAIRQVAKTSLILCTSLYLAAALSGYLLFGEETSSDILANFDADLNLSGSRSLTVVVRIGYALHVVLVFPLVHFALRENVDNLVFPEAGPLVGDTRRFWATTGVLMGAIFVGAAVVPNIWIAFQFTGATSAVAIGFLFPALVALRDKSGAIYPTERLLARSMLVLAVAVSVTGVFSSVVGLIGG